MSNILVFEEWRILSFKTFQKDNEVFHISGRDAYFKTFQVQSIRLTIYQIFQKPFSHNFMKKSIQEEYSFHFQLMVLLFPQNPGLIREQVSKTRNLTILKSLNHRQKYLMFLCLSGRFYFDGIKTMPSKVEKCMILLHFHFRLRILSKFWIRKLQERISWRHGIRFSKFLMSFLLNLLQT